jgi:hypothetical protein
VYQEQTYVKTDSNGWAGITAASFPIKTVRGQANFAGQPFSAGEKKDTDKLAGLAKWVAYGVSTGIVFG